MKPNCCPIRPTPKQRAEMAAYIDAREPDWLDELGIDRANEAADEGGKHARP